MERNPHFAELPDRYLFNRIGEAKNRLLASHPDVSLISLGIGDTTEPLVEAVTEAMSAYSAQLGSSSGYQGYGPSEGWAELREAISYRIYQGKVEADDIFISDGAKCDMGRLGILLGSGRSVAIQDPSYPVYLDLSHLLGHRIALIPCTAEHDFCPTQLPTVDVFYLCNPNNPTGTALSRHQLQDIVNWAHLNRSLIIFDAAYSAYIQDPTLPRSIFEIPGACEVAIEVNSFSKLAGFTGVRLGWSVVPKTLTYRNGSSMRSDWLRIVTTLFNGASNVAQAGGLACLQADGWAAIQQQLSLYLRNGETLRQALNQAGARVFGGIHSPFLWARCASISSWDLFHFLLQEAHLVTVPGAGFGIQGEGYLRLSSFGTPQQIQEGAKRLLQYLPQIQTLSNQRG